MGFELMESRARAGRPVEERQRFIVLKTCDLYWYELLSMSG
jgi:hypothetical protein